jgi:hypothetical protein
MESSGHREIEKPHTRSAFVFLVRGWFSGFQITAITCDPVDSGDLLSGSPDFVFFTAPLVPQ